MIVKDRIIRDSFPEPNTGCWLWTRHCNHRGYGSISIKDRTYRASRASYEAFIGPIPEGGMVCHRCDTPQCVNPDHLFLGTCQDNVIDAVKKGRWAHQIGEKNAQAKISEETAINVKAAIGSNASIARRFGISATHVSQIKRAVRWRHLP